MYSKFRWANTFHKKNLDAFTFFLNTLDGTNKATSDITFFSSQFVTYSSTEVSALASAEIKYTSTVDLPLAGKEFELRFKGDFNSNSGDPSNQNHVTILMSDRAVVANGRWQFAILNNRVALLLLTDINNLVRYDGTIPINYDNTTYDIKVVYDDNNDTCQITVNGVADTLSRLEIGTYNGIRTGTTGQLALFSAGYTNNFNFRGFCQQSSIKIL